MLLYPAQLNYDTAQDAGGTVTATRSTGALTLSGVVAVSVDNTATKEDIRRALMALNRILNEEFISTNLPAQLATTGTITR